MRPQKLQICPWERFKIKIQTQGDCQIKMKNLQAQVIKFYGLVFESLIYSCQNIKLCKKMMEDIRQQFKLFMSSEEMRRNVVDGKRKCFKIRIQTEQVIKAKFQISLQHKKQNQYLWQLIRDQVAKYFNNSEREIFEKKMEQLATQGFDWTFRQKSSSDQQ